MKGILRILLCCALPILLGLSSCIKEEPESDEVVSIGHRLPNFSVEMNDGRMVTNQTLLGKVSMIVFFHTGCPDCRQTLPRVQRIYDKYATEGVEFVLISREEVADSVAAYWQRNGLTLPYSAQADRRVYELFAHKRVPRVYINDRDGIIKHVFTDDPIPMYESMDDALSTLL